MASINFLYRSTKDKSSLILRLLYRFNESDYVFGAKTKCEVEKTYWNKQHNKKSKDADIQNMQFEINTELQKLKNHVLNAFNISNPTDVNKEWLETQIDHYYNPPKKEKILSSELLKYFEYYINCQKNKTTIGTQRKYNSTLRLLERFQKEKKTTIKILDVNESFKNELEQYCLVNNYAPNTISKFFKTIKGVCNHANYNGVETSHQLKGFKTDQHKVEKIYLTIEELTKIESIGEYKLTSNLKIAVTIQPLI